MWPVFLWCFLWDSLHGWNGTRMNVCSRCPKKSFAFSLELNDPWPQSCPSTKIAQNIVPWRKQKKGRMAKASVGKESWRKEKEKAREATRRKSLTTKLMDFEREGWKQCDGNWRFKSVSDGTLASPALTLSCSASMFVTLQDAK
mmetsp:Transcript_11357/g.19246  ORF Transcript_11357/g.19246 Transcript_11357/m.19246 type:complete len:144 (-) Transcript_11357:37-468(-)